MKNPKNVVINKGCHSRMSLSGIYNARCCQIKDDSLLNRYVEDPRQKPSGMTTNFNHEEALNKGSFRAPLRSGFTARFVIPQGRYAGYSGRVGFTLIELLVVVLIIGILAAVAVPQYQFAVEKSRLSEALLVMNSLKKAINLYLLEHGLNGEVELLGDSEQDGISGRLNIDLENALDCTQLDGDKCGSKFFIYDAYCDDTECNIWAYRTKDGQYANGTQYSLNLISNRDGSDWDKYFQANANFPYSIRLKKSLEADGWK